MKKCIFFYCFCIIGIGTGYSTPLVVIEDPSDLSLTAQLGQCQPSARNCDFYHCAEKVFQCGQEGYFQSTASPLCGENIEGIGLNAKTKTFTLRVRQCLQEEVLKFAPRASDCSEIKDAALDSHIPCFLNNGYCELSFSDKRDLFDNPFSFLTISGPIQMFKMWRALKRGCDDE